MSTCGRGVAFRQSNFNSGLWLLVLVLIAAPTDGRAEEGWRGNLPDAAERSQGPSRPSALPKRAAADSRAVRTKATDNATSKPWKLREDWVPDTSGDGRKEGRPDQQTDPGEPKKPDVLIGDHYAPASGGKWQWKVTKTEWSVADEAAFGEFLRRIGESECKTTQECLTSPVANPAYHATNPPGMTYFADCADLPYFLRGYFASKNGLPYSFSTAVDLHPGIKRAKGDHPSFQIIGRYHIVAPGPDPRLALAEVGRVSTAHFRTPADYRGRMLPDYYPVKLGRESIKAGTVIFDPLGHIAIVFKVDADGHVHFIDAHPDNSLTRGIYGSEIERAGPDTGAGFKRWRPQQLVGARRAKDGALSGGQMVLTKDRDLADWSDEQFYGTGAGRAADWKAGRFLLDGEAIDYGGYVRLVLAPPGYKFDPLAETRSRVRNLCRELGYRVDAVAAAVKGGLHLRPQPPRLPSNIYITQGDWETYSTPSRDAQLKTIFKGLREDVERFMTLGPAGSRFISYGGHDLRGDLLATYTTEAAACTITYIKSDGSPQTLGFEEVKRRLFQMSFDPHHCVERRWGADAAEELKSCKDDTVKAAWYDAQRRLRNQTVRTIGDRMDFTLDDLKRHARENSEVGDNDPPEIDVLALLAAPR